jgi:hypothetical protein
MNMAQMLHRGYRGFAQAFKSSIFLEAKKRKESKRRKM